MKYLLFAISVPLFLLATGCATPAYVEGYYYDPHPLVAALPTTQPSQPPPVSAYATIVGIRNADDKQHLPLSVEVRLRVDNNQSDTITLDPRTMDLTTGDLVRFEPPLITPPAAITIPPGASAMLTAEFPFPPGTGYDKLNLKALQWRWTLMVGPQRVDQVADFRLEYHPTYYAEPTYYPYPYVYPYPVFGGVVVIRHHW